MRILIATDAWLPQINGVVRTLSTTVEWLRRLGHDVQVIEPGQFLSFPCAVYPEIHLALPDERPLWKLIRDFDPDAIHIATEGPIGFQVRRLCVNRRLRFTSAFHTKFAEYLHALIKVPVALGYLYLRWFHAASVAMMVATRSMEEELRRHGFLNRIVRWSRAVDTERFYPREKSPSNLARPQMLYVGRVSREKNVEAFLQLRTIGTKCLVGDGPARTELAQKYPDAIFRGPLTGEPLAQAYAAADVFVFPSRTDTFGLVILEALASGVPVAAYPVAGPRDILTSPLVGALHENLEIAVEKAQRHGDPEECVRLASRYRWEECTRQFLANLVSVRGGSQPILPDHFASMPTLRA